MKKNSLIFILIILLIGIFFIGCPASIPTGSGSSDNENDNNENNYVEGTTLPAAIINSTPITLPAGVTLSKMNGGALSLISTFPSSIILTNNTSTTYNYILKAGSNFWVDSGNTQNLIIVWDINITIKPGNNPSIILPTFCINPELNGPDSYDNYCLGTVYTDSCMGQIINILSTKNPSTFDLVDIMIIQDAIGECMENGSLSTTTTNLLKGI